MAEQDGTTTPEGQEPEGGSTAASEQGTEGQEPEATTTYSEEDVAGLKSALEKEKQRRKDLQAQVKEREEAQRANMTEAEQAVAQARAEGVRIGNERLARAEVITAAVDAGFADPKDAAVFLQSELAEFVDEDGEVDTDSIAKAVKALAKRKQHLLTTTTARKAGADTSGGGKPSTSTPDPEADWNSQLRQVAGPVR